jgi:hypothetical protein
MKSLVLVLVVAFVLIAENAVLATDLQPGTLCQIDEKVMFSCPVKNGTRLVSLCGSKDLTDKTGYLQYRFGRAGEIDLEFPTRRQNSQKMFRYAHYFRPQVDRFSVSFVIKDYTYTVFKNYEGDIEPKVNEVGVQLTLPGQAEREIPCVGMGIGNLHGLKSIVPCDTDDALNMGECP